MIPIASNTLSLSGETALVTGGSRGIGRAVALAFAAAGARVAVAYGGREDLARDTLSHLPGSGHLALGADLADAEACRRLVDDAATALGRLDVLVNNAGIFVDHPPLESSWESWRRAWESTLAVNLLAPAHLSFHAARRMADAGGGRIVNVSSRAAFRGEVGGPGYAASKAGMNAMGQSLAKALAPRSVYVYTVAPGWVATDMAADSLAADGAAIRAQSPFDRIATPEEVAQVVLFLAASRNAFLTGAVVDVNGASYLRT